MPTSRHHTEWLSLIEVSGPFLSVPVLDRVFPQGLDPHDPDHVRVLKLAFEEWEDDRDSDRPRPAIHREWIRFVIRQTLGFSKDANDTFDESALAEDQSVPATIRATISEHGETLRPDFVVHNPGESGEWGAGRGETKKAGGRGRKAKSSPDGPGLNLSYDDDDPEPAGDTAQAPENLPVRSPTRTPRADLRVQRASAEKRVSRAIPIDHIETDAIMAAFRQAARGRAGWSGVSSSNRSPSSSATSALGPKIDESLRGHLRTAIRRRIIEADGPSGPASTKPLLQ